MDIPRDRWSEDDVYHGVEIGRWVEKRRLANDAIESEVAGARRQNMSWAKIGVALGVTAQSAWERYGLTPEQKQQERDRLAMRFRQLELIPDVELVEPAAQKKQKRRKPHAGHEA